MTKLVVLNTEPLDNKSIFDFYIHSISEFRQNKVNSYFFQKDKNLSLGAAIIIDRELQKYGISEKLLTYKLSENGKPYFNELLDFHFSISHSGLYSVVAFSNQEVGCDIEEMTEIDPSVKARCLSEKETAAAKEDKDFFKLWSLKESYLKAKGIGLCDNLKDITLETINKEFYSKSFDFIDGYSLAICHKETQELLEPELIRI